MRYALSVLLSARLLGAATLVAASLIAAAGCSESSANDAPAEQRTVEVHVPDSYKPEEAAPLLILLHGYTSSGANHERYLKLGSVLNEAGFLYVHPDGTRDCRGDRHWDASEACCHFCGTPVDDTAYLREMIDDIGKRYRIDARRLYIIGHSNGGFMGYRLACDHADVFAAVVSIAGATPGDGEDCGPSEPVHILQIHGDRDGTVPFRGGEVQGRAYPSALRSAELWAGYNGCALEPAREANALDLVPRIPGRETSVTHYNRDCRPGGSVELWTIEGGGHVPKFAPDFARRLVDFLLAHPKTTRRE